MWVCLCGWTNWQRMQQCYNCGGSRALAKELGITLKTVPEYAREIVRMQFTFVLAIILMGPFVVIASVSICLGFLWMIVTLIHLCFF